MNKLHNPTQNFTVIPNELFELKISAEAKHIYAYLRSKPDGWNVRMDDIQKQLQSGRDKAYRVRKELIGAELLSYKALHDGGGVYSLHEITVSLKSRFRKIPIPCFPDSVKPVSEKSARIVKKERAVNTERAIVNTDKSKEKVNQKEKDFETWWLQYPRKIKKAEAKRIWIKLDLPDITVMLNTLTMQCQQWDDPKFIPHPTTYLNNERYYDEIQLQAAQQASTPYDRAQAASAAYIERINTPDPRDNALTLEQTGADIWE